MGRTIIVGDVHGCREELSGLLDRVAFTSGDLLVFVGDLVARGPDSLGVLDIARQTGALVIRGNHERKLLAWRARQKKSSRSGKPPPPTERRPHHSLAEQLRDVDWSLLETASYWLELPTHGVLVVHAGLLPGRPLEEQQVRTLLHIRGIDARGEVSVEKACARLWGAFYEGPPHVVFGHNAYSEPQLHPWATGIDTACVYGGRLTALVLAAGEPIPRGGAVLANLFSEPAARIYFDYTQKGGRR